MSKSRIRSWVNEYGEDGVYISFSGGKDSTVLLDLVRQDYPNIVAVFCDTGLEYPEIRDFVKTFDNVEIIKPQMNFKEVIRKYGYPIISKEQAQKIYEFRNTNSEKLARTHLYKPKYGISSKHLHLVYSPFKIGNQCCNIMKKKPFKQYSKKTHRHPFTGQMASEGMLRTNQWLMYGCNMYDAKEPKSHPLSFWMEEDILQYIKNNKLKIASVYGEILDRERGGYHYQVSTELAAFFAALVPTWRKNQTGFNALKYHIRLNIATALAVENAKMVGGNQVLKDWA